MVELFPVAFVFSFALATAFAFHLGLPQNLKTHNAGSILAVRLWGWMFLLIYGVVLALFRPALLWAPLGGFPFGWLLLSAALLGVAVTITAFALQRWSGAHEQSASMRAANIAEGLWLLGLSLQRREQYEWHGRWRLEVFFRRIRRRWEDFSLRRDLPNLRWLVVLLAAAISLVAFHTVLKSGLGDWLNQMMFSNSAGMATLQITLLGSAVAYVVWLFRDINLREQIENQRKDVNLKDFQRLAEWAAGLHLPEDKIVNSEKTADGETETVRSTETSVGMNHDVLPAPSRREGAASLQIAAIYQLQTFLNGEYGRYFQRPAFQLLKSIWLALTSRHLAAWEREVMAPSREDCPLIFPDTKNKKKDSATGVDRLEEQRRLFQERVRMWRRTLQVLTQTALFRAINAALGQAHGALLRQHSEDLPGTNLIGYQGANMLELDSLSGLDLRSMQFHGADLHGVQLHKSNLFDTKLHGAILNRAELHGADLSWAELCGADLNRAELHGGDLSAADLHVANLSWAKLYGADLSWGRLYGADLSDASLRGADLTSAKLRGANLSSAEFHGANLSGAELQGCLLLDPVWDERTIWGETQTDEHTRIFRAKRKRYKRGFPDDYDIDAPATFALRRELRDRGLVLPDILYRRLFSTDTEDHPDGDKP